MSGRLYSESRGRGPDLVLWHGWGMNVRVFDPLVDHLAEHFRVTSFDLPGHGRSPSLHAGDLEAALPELLAVLPEGCALAGWSLGGLLAMRAAQRAPGRLRGLILLHSTPKFVAAADWPHGIAASLLQQFAQSLQRAQERTVNDFIDLQVRGSRDAAAVTHRLRESLRLQGHAQATALSGGLELLRHADLREVAAQIHVPTLIFSGQYDRVTPPAASRALAAVMPVARVEELPRAGHASFLSHAQTVATLCSGWLQAHQAARVAV
jgi:pimeloyl-[acyl-carrier protein] methyl ester esterase